MEKREDALREALAKNEEEVQRWESYIKENETAINNMAMFNKMLTVDVMVPIGKKAFMPGHLIHTNEVLVGHYQDYFSKCSVYTATKICEKRVQNGKTHLEQLETEKDLFQNKLEKPHLQGVLPNAEEREIIEEYDDEKENLWREEHRRRVREAKLKEKKEREEQQIKDKELDELFQKLEEEELLAELNEELSEYINEPEKDTEEILKKMMSGDLNLPPPKKRIAHSKETNGDSSVPLTPLEPKTMENQSVKTIIDNIVNLTVNSQLKHESFDNEHDSDTSISSDTPEEIRLLEKQAEYLPHDDRIGFYQYQLQIIDQKIATHSFSNNKELEEKLRLFKIRDHLEELLEILEEGMPSETDSQTDIDKMGDKEKISDAPQKRRISFALENQMLEFRKNETVAEMLPTNSTEDKPPRDIIRLDEPIVKEDIPTESEGDGSTKIVDRQKTILDKVEENLKTLNLEDADLVDKIIHSSVNRIQTLFIHFKHSPKIDVKSNFDKSIMPTSPADFYEMVKSENNPDEKNFYLKESDRDRAYVDVRSQFLTPVTNEQVPEELQAKSILKNKAMVERETHVTPKEDVEQKPVQKSRKKPKKGEDEYLSAYNKVMGDVIENPTVTPDPLPEGNFVDMHAPKQRLSRFKQLRNNKK